MNVIIICINYFIFLLIVKYTQLYVYFLTKKTRFWVKLPFLSSCNFLVHNTFIITICTIKKLNFYHPLALSKKLTPEPKTYSNQRCVPLFFSFVHKFPRIPQTGGYIRLKPTKSRTLSQALEVGEPGVPLKGNPWIPDVPQATYCL